MQYYSVVRKNEIRNFPGKWIELERIILRGEQQGISDLTGEMERTGRALIQKGEHKYRRREE